MGAVLGPSPDAAIFLTVGEAIAEGGVPYRDVWDHKPPGIYLVAALAVLSPLPAWPTLVVFTVLSAAAAGAAIIRVAGRWAGLIAVVTLALPAVALGGGMTETFAAAPAGAAFLAAARARWVAAGALAMVAVLFSVQLAALAPALVVLGGWRPRSLRDGVVGGLLVLTPIVLWLGAAGAIPAAWEQLVDYQRAYLALDRSADIGRDGGRLVLSLLPIALLAILAVRPRRRIEWATLAWLAGAILLVAVGGRLFSHYAGFLVPPLAIVAGAGVRRIGRHRRWVGPVLLLALAAWAVVSFTAMRSTAHPSEAVGRAVQRATGPTDRILVWGFEAWTYAVADRDPAGRYAYLVPLVTPGYTTRSMIEAWVADLASDPPTIIVDAEADHPHWPEDGDFLRPPPPGTAGGRDLDLLDPFRDFVADRYELAFEVEGRKVYRLR